MFWYSFSPACILWWIIRLLFCEKVLSNWLTWYGFSPVCILLWFIRILFTEKTLLHWYGLFLECILWCFISQYYLRKPDHIVCIDMVDHPCVFFDFLKDGFSERKSIKWLLSSMYSLMIYETTFHCESLVTLPALIWFLPRLGSLVVL